MVEGYKWLSQDLTSELYLPWVIGEWKVFDNKLATERCPKYPLKGFRASRKPYDSLEYNYGTRWFRIEAEEIVDERFNSFTATTMVLKKELPVKDLLLKYSIECARRCLYVYEGFSRDTAPRNAIEATEAYVKSQTEENIKRAVIAAEEAKNAAEKAGLVKTDKGLLAGLSAASAWRTAELVALTDSDIAGTAKVAAWHSIRSIAMGITREIENKQVYARERDWQNSVLEKLIKESLEEEKKS